MEGCKRERQITESSKESKVKSTCDSRTTIGFTLDHLIILFRQDCRKRRITPRWPSQAICASLLGLPELCARPLAGLVLGQGPTMSSSSGSSNGSPSAANAALPPPEASTSYAPYPPNPRAGYASVEYPSTVSHPSAILRLVSQEDINECFNTAINKPTMLEIKFGGSDRSGVPIRGNRVPSQKLLLKISRRRRRREQDEGMGTEDAEKGPVRPGAEEGIFTSEIVGPIPQTVRFRCMLTVIGSQTLD